MVLCPDFKDRRFGGRSSEKKRLILPYHMGQHSLLWFVSVKKTAKKVTVFTICADFGLS